MNGKMLIALTAALLIATGCSNRIVGSELTEDGHWYGELGITGHTNNIIIRAPSELTKLSVIGDANRIFVEDRVTLGKIEVWGSDNTISIPERLVVRINQWGKRTRIVRRPWGQSPESFFPGGTTITEPTDEQTRSSSNTTVETVYYPSVTTGSGSSSTGGTYRP